MALIEGIAALLAKVASASTIAQATAGLGIAVAGVAGAGAAGVLPGPVQDGVAGAVEAVTPFDLPSSTDDRISGIDDRHTVSDVAPEDDGPGVVPAISVPVPVVAVPTTEPGEHENEAEHGIEESDGTHQHRGGRSPSVPAHTAESADDSTDDSAPREVEVENHDGGEDSSGHGGGDSGGGSGGGDSSGHGGGDD
jgi:uncharacterized membrane protein YgcG